MYENTSAAELYGMAEVVRQQWVQIAIELESEGGLEYGGQDGRR